MCQLHYTMRDFLATKIAPHMNDANIPISQEALFLWPYYSGEFPAVDWPATGVESPERFASRLNWSIARAIRQAFMTGFLAAELMYNKGRPNRLEELGIVVNKDEE